VASNIQKHFEQLGKAGRARWLGRRPEVRGLAMNAGRCSHPRKVTPQANTTQLITLTVVDVVNRRVTCTQSAPGVLRPREATRHDTRGTSTHSWSRTDHETRASASRSKSAARARCISILFVKLVSYIAWPHHKLLLNTSSTTTIVVLEAPLYSRYCDEEVVGPNVKFMPVKRSKRRPLRSPTSNVVIRPAELLRVTV
jgi:hypothetical protein